MKQLAGPLPIESLRGRVVALRQCRASVHFRTVRAGCEGKLPEKVTHFTTQQHQYLKRWNDTVDPSSQWTMVAVAHPVANSTQHRKPHRTQTRKVSEERCHLSPGVTTRGHRHCCARRWEHAFVAALRKCTLMQGKGINFSRLLSSPLRCAYKPFPGTWC